MMQPYMPLGPVHDIKKVERKDEQDYDIPLHDGVMQPLIPQTVHITPPDDDYVALATNLILHKQLNEFGKEFSDMTRVDENVGLFVAYAKRNRDSYRSELGLYSLYIYH
ncbi:hypothetical protein Tco_1148444 [Tanacetum coccineum]